MADRLLSVEVAGSPEVAGETKPRRNPAHAGRLLDIPYPDEPHVNNVQAVFQRAHDKFADLPFLGHRPILPGGTRGEYVWATYRQVFAKANHLARGLQILCGLQPKQPVGIYGINRPEWTTGWLALYTRNMFSVPLYDTLGANAVTFIVTQSELTTILCERSKLKFVVEAAPKCPLLKHVVLFEDVTDADRALVDSAFELHSYSSLVEASERTPEGYEVVSPEPSDLAILMFTSGTTGDPKGVLLSHKNVLGSATGLHLLDYVRHDDVYISYLPLAHSFETCLQMLTLLTGACIGFYQGDVRKLVAEDIPMLRPTVMAGVPRVYSRVYDKITQGVAEKGGISKFLFDWAYSSQSYYDDRQDRSKLWDALVFNKVKERLGGRIRIIATGAAPMSADLQKFLRTVFGCPVLQGYGMTENAAAAFAMPEWYSTNGTVGSPLPCTEFKLVDVEEMGYTSRDVYPRTAEEFSKSAAFKGDFKPELAGRAFPRGEVWLRGSNVFGGYFKLEKDTQETLTEDGWLKTGDVGQINPDGSLSIIDRKKNIFKLAQGEYVAAEAIEAALSTSSYVMQCWVYGNSFKTALVTVIVPDREVLVKYAREKGLTTDFAQLCASEDIKKLIFADITAAGKSAKLKGFEFPKAILIEGQVDSMGMGFTVENDCLTPTQKLRRPQLLKRYHPQIDKLYETIVE